MPRVITAKPDPALCRDQLQALNYLLKAFGMKFFCQSMIWLLVKEQTEFLGIESSRLVPFNWNLIQTHLYGNLAKMNRVLKARQAGLTTFFLLVRLFIPIILEGGKTGMLISQNSRYASLHFSMVRRAWRLFGAVDPGDKTANAVCESYKANLLHTTYSNRRELVFDQLDSRLIVESAEVEESAQGITLHHVVASEVARWKGSAESTMSNILGALVKTGTADEECTANGMGGYFCDRYLASLNAPDKADMKPHFYEHYWSADYQDTDLTEIEKDELQADLTADELRLIAKMHQELSSVAFLKAA